MEEREAVIEDPSPPSDHNPIPRWLIWTYILCLVWGVLWFLLFWNGNGDGWLDRGGWMQLQEAANTRAK